MKISEDILNILEKCRIEGNIVYLPDKPLDRKVYLAVNKHLENLGGKWNRKAKGHVFNSDPTNSFEHMLLTGETTDFKKEFQFFETPPELAMKMVEMAELDSLDEEGIILEPSAGHGAIIDCIDTLPMGVMITAAEINHKNCEILIKKGFGIVEEGDFLTMGCLVAQWDRIIMNPPFTKQQDIMHIRHAWSILKDGGMLVSVVSESPFFRENSVSVEFREFLDKVNAEIIINPEGTFKDSGTMVRTRLIKIVK